MLVKKSVLFLANWLPFLPFSDTFPTPMLLNFWPTDIICNRDAGTDHWMEDVRQDTFWPRTNPYITMQATFRSERHLFLKGRKREMVFWTIPWYPG
jgi:hypothetical protein